MLISLYADIEGEQLEVTVDCRVPYTLLVEERWPGKGYIIQGDHLHRDAADVVDRNSLYVSRWRVRNPLRHTKKPFHIAPSGFLFLMYSKYSLNDPTQRPSIDCIQFKR